MSALMDAVVEFLGQEEWAHESHPDGDAVRMKFRGEAGEWIVAAQEVGDGGGKLVVYSLPSVTVPAAHRDRAAQAVCRMNHGVILGNWELDLDEGEVRYKTSADLRGTTPTAEMVRHLVFTNVMMTDRYLPALLGVVFGDKDPKAAVDEVEGA